MADKKRGTFTVSEYLESQGMQLLGKGAGNKIRVQNPSGDIGTFDPILHIKSEGFNPADIDIQINTPESASELSPVSVGQRAQLSLGNVKGGLKFLRQKFEDARLHPEQGLLVKDQGVWSKVDPSGLGSGDAWDMAAEFAADAADWIGDVPIIGLSTAGAIGGATVGAPTGPGAVATAVAGSGLGAGTGEALRTSLGRIVGTYEASAEDQLGDIGMETLFGLGGQGVAMGAKPALRQLAKAGAAINAKAAPGVKRVLSEALGKSTGVGPKGVETFIDNSAPVAAKMKQLASRAKTPSEVDTIASELQLRKANEFLENASKELPKQYEVALQKVFDQAEAKGVTVNMSKIIRNATDNLEARGIGKVDPKTKIFRALSPEEQGARARAGQDVELLDRATFNQVRGIVADLNNFSKIGTVRGETAARTLAALNKTLNKRSQDVFKDPTKAQLGRIIALTSEGYRNGVNKTMAEKGLTKPWGEAQNIYSRFANSVNSARKIMKSDEQVNTFAGRLLQDSVTGRRAQGLASDLVTLTGKRGQQLYEDIIFTETARRFSPWMPKMGLISGLAPVGAGGLGVGVARETISPGTGFAIASQFSPKFVSGELRASMAMLDMIKTIPDRTRLQLLAQPDAMRAMFQTVAGQEQRERQMTEQLLQQSGAVGGQENNAQR